MTIERIGQDMIELVPDLAAFCPPAELLDKRVYSPWYQTDLETRLKNRCIDTLIISGGETDVCVLATALGAVDRGLRVVLATDARCSSSDETHDALLKVYKRRYSQQIEAVSTEVILRNGSAAWNDTAATSQLPSPFGTLARSQSSQRRCGCALTKEAPPRRD